MLSHVNDVRIYVVKVDLTAVRDRVLVQDFTTVKGRDGQAQSAMSQAAMSVATGAVQCRQARADSRGRVPGADSHI
jgi:hypothetical protein